MATLKEYICKSCGYTVLANPKGKDVLMSGETIETPLPDKCPKCRGELEKTDMVLMVD